MYSLTIQLRFSYSLAVRSMQAVSAAEMEKVLRRPYSYVYEPSIANNYKECIHLQLYNTVYKELFGHLASLIKCFQLLHCLGLCSGSILHCDTYPD